MHFITSSFILFVIYLMLTQNLESANLVLGVLVALGITLLMPKDVPMLASPARLPKFLWAVVRYSLMVIWDVIRGGLSTARIVLDPKMPLKAGILAIPSESKSELGTAMSAHSITLSPGELVIEMDGDGVMYTHCLNVEETANIVSKAQAQRNKLLSSMFE